MKNKVVFFSYLDCQGLLLRSGRNEFDHKTGILGNTRPKISAGFCEMSMLVSSQKEGSSLDFLCAKKKKT